MMLPMSRVPTLTGLRALAALFCLSSLTVFGQVDANKGQIVGTVYDGNRAVVPGAKVRIQNTGTGLTRDLVSSGEGQYRFVQLDPGSYQLVAESNGFAAATINGIVVTVGSAINVDVTLQVQATSTTVEVSATMISDVVPAPSTTVNSTAITNLPINGRRVQDFAVLTPAVQANDGTRGQISFVGQRAIYSNIMLDGADNNQPFFGGIRGGERSNFVLTVPQSAVQEFQVVTTGYTAEYGRSTGGVMNTITKSGTNNVHGEAFYQNRNRKFSAQSPIPVLDPLDLTADINVRRKLRVTPSETLQQFGGAAGGPAIKDKLFWFGAIEAQRADIPRQSVFPQLGNITANALTQPTIDFFRSEQRSFTQDNKSMALLGRGDYLFAKGHRLTARYTFSDATENNAVTVGGATNPFSQFALSNEGTEKDRIHNGTLQYTHLFSPTVVNDVRFSGSYEIRPRLANSNTASVSNFIGNFGARNFLPTTQDDTRWQITDSLTVLKGKHSLKFGMDYSRLSTFQFFGFNQFGTFNTNVANAQTTAQLLGGNGTNGGNRFDGTSVIYSRQIGDLIADYGIQQLAFFAQDNIRVSNSFTLDLGLRWEGQYNPTPASSNTTLVDRVKAVTFPLGARLDPTVMKDATNQFAPRVGFAWNPISGAHRTVVRGHTGMFYGATPMIVFSGGTNNFRAVPGDVSISIGGDSTRPSIFNVFQQVGVNLNSASLNSLPVIPVDVVQRAAQVWLGGGTLDPFNGAALTLNAADFVNPRSFQMGFGVDTEVFRNFIAGVQVNYVNTVNLLRNRNYNLGVPVINATDQSQRPSFTGRQRIGIPTLSTITVRESSARGMYRGITFQAQYRVKKLQASAFYTLSQNYSDSDSERDATGFEYVNSFNLRDEYNYSSQDIRNQITANAVYTLPWGIEVGGISRFNTGLPFTARVGTDVNGDGNNNDRPFSAPGQPFARNGFRNRNFARTDVRLMKSFKLGPENMRVQLSAEFFNLFNAENVIFGGNNQVYGAGFQANGTMAPVNAQFRRLRLTDGSYDPNNSQVGNPFQAQFGVRFFF
ncbi:Oar protein [Bryobacterales bacterium F-183]|nr:Oar protein [Bryobacterales bacterium F-183]